MPQLVSTGEIKAAPQTAFGQIGQLLQRLGLQLPGRFVVGVCKHNVVNDFEDPALISFVVGLRHCSAWRFLRHFPETF